MAAASAAAAWRTYAQGDPSPRLVGTVRPGREVVLLTTGPCRGWGGGLARRAVLTAAPYQGVGGGRHGRGPSQGGVVLARVVGVRLQRGDLQAHPRTQREGAQDLRVQVGLVRGAPDPQAAQLGD